MRGRPTAGRVPLGIFVLEYMEENVSLKPIAKPPYPPLELKSLSPKAALEWLESKSSSSDRATSEQIEELKRYVRALIPEENGE